MKRYIFLTTEGSTYQPDTASLEPDIENMQVIGFGEGHTARDALEYLILHSEYLVDTNFDEIYAIQLANDYREFFSLRGIMRKSIKTS